MKLHGRRRPRLPSRHDWLDYLDTDIERRDRRVGFLWAVTLSLVAGVVALARLIIGGQGPADAREWLVACGVAAATYIVVAKSFADRLLHAINPNTIFVDFSLRTAIGFLRYVRKFGVPASSRAAAASVHVAQTMLGITLIALRDLLGWWHWVPLIVGFPLLANGIFFSLAMFVAGHRFRWVATLFGMLILHLLRLVLDERTLRRYPSMVKELEENSNVPASLRRFFPDQTKTANLTFVVSRRATIPKLIYAGLIAWPLAAAAFAIVPVRLTSILPVLTGAVAVVGVLVAVRLGTRLYFDNEREKIEQLRMLIFFDDDALLLAYPLTYALLREFSAAEFYDELRVYNLIRELSLAELMVQDSTVLDAK